MEFSTPFFLFIFFPIFILIYTISHNHYKKWLILIASLVLYAWFQRTNFLIVGVLILLNYLLLILFWKIRTPNLFHKSIFIFTICFNILFLLFFKIFTTTNWIHTFIDTEFPNFTFIQSVTFPIGLSFIIFQIISCLIDTQNDIANAPQHFASYANYLFMFPKILVGPITRFNKVNSQLESLNTSLEMIAKGSRRFIIGLSKKILIADQLAIMVNAGFNLPVPAYPTSIAWTILIGYFLQIYYDFSGYIDMGLGIATMLGLSLPENFNRPYASRSLTEFWRGWHMTLLSWFRDYVFYPLEFKRRGETFLRRETNTVIVFLLTGLWHGITLNYILWGFIQGLIISFENSRFGKWIKKIPSIFQRMYLIFIILMSWVIFRSPNMGFALRFFKRLFIIDQSVQLYPFSLTKPLPIINNSVILILILGIVCLLPLNEWWKNISAKLFFPAFTGSWVSQSLFDFGYLILLVASICVLAGQNFVPSIYGGF